MFFSELPSQPDDQPIKLTLIPLVDSLPQISLNVYPFQTLELIKRIVIQRIGIKLRLSEVEVFWKSTQLSNRTQMVTLASGPALVLYYSFKEKSSLSTKSIRMCGSYALELSRWERDREAAKKEKELARQREREERAKAKQQEKALEGREAQESIEGRGALSKNATTPGVLSLAPEPNRRRRFGLTFDIDDSDIGLKPKKKVSLDDVGLGLGLDCTEKHKPKVKKSLSGLLATSSSVKPPTTTPTPTPTSISSALSKRTDPHPQPSNPLNDLLKMRQRFLETVQKGMLRHNPRLTEEGTGASYLMKSVMDRYTAVFKPIDEEAFAPNNPRGFAAPFGSRGFRSGVVSGEGALREVIAYDLDAKYGSFSSVPLTLLTEACHPFFCYDPVNPKQFRADDDLFAGFVKKQKKKEEKEGIDSNAELKLSYWKTGSLQAFVSNAESCGDYNSDMFLTADVHKIAILDIRLCNLDRNDGNVLVVRHDMALLDPRLSALLSKSEAGFDENNPTAKIRLVPIDHGLTLPDCLEVSEYDLTWYYWNQIKEPLSETAKAYIASLDPDSDARYITDEYRVRPECARTMQVTTRLLKIGVAAGLNLFDITQLMIRPNDDELSELEKTVKIAITQTLSTYYNHMMIGRRMPGTGAVVQDLEMGGGRGLMTPPPIMSKTDQSICEKSVGFTTECAYGSPQPTPTPSINANVWDRSDVISPSSIMTSNSINKYDGRPKRTAYRTLRPNVNEYGHLVCGGGKKTRNTTWLPPDQSEEFSAGVPPFDEPDFNVAFFRALDVCLKFLVKSKLRRVGKS